jgi:hypothetical protein
VNAFLLLTSAALAGADAAPAGKPGPVAGAPAAGAPAAGAPAHGAPLISSAPGSGSCCGGGCGSSCDSCGDSCCESESFFSKLKGRFHKKSCCEESCDTCDTCGHGHKSHGHKSCECAPACDCGSSCDSCCESGGFFSKLKGRFHKKSCCEESCDTCGGCNGGHGATYGGATYGAAAPGTMSTVPGQAPVRAMPSGEPIKAPRDANPGKKLPAGGGRTNLDPIPEVTPTTPARPAAPAATQGLGTSNNPNPF